METSVPPLLTRAEALLLNLPLRNGNVDSASDVTLLDGLLNLPLRNGNFGLAGP